MRNHRAFSVFARWSNYQQKFCKKMRTTFGEPIRSNLYSYCQSRIRARRNEKIWNGTTLVLTIIYISYFAGQYLSYLTTY